MNPFFTASQKQYTQITADIILQFQPIIAKNIKYFQTALNQSILAHQTNTATQSLIKKHLNSFPDKRFEDPTWDNTNTPFPLIKQSYLLLREMLLQAIDQAVMQTKTKDPKLGEQLKYIMQFLIDALAPTNFAATNPTVLKVIEETSGKNLIEGYQNLLLDLQTGHTPLTPISVNKKSFCLGKNLATTPGAVIFQNKIMQLIQYTPSTKKVYQRPILMLPPWINKYYIFDLQKHNSMVKWLVDQGYLVFIISWVNPQSLKQNRSFEDYMKEGPLKALTIINKIVKEEVNMLGYCVSGTLQACTLAYLNSQKQKKVHSTTYITTLLDFQKAGLLGSLVNEQNLRLIKSQIEKKGYLEGSHMAMIFNSLRPNDLIWPTYIRRYLKAENPPSIDFLYWNTDSTHIPAALQSFYLEEFYLKNVLASNKSFHLLDTMINIKNMNIPSYFLAAKEDHIVPWEAAFKSAALLGTKTRFVLSRSGHVAGVINPPSLQKYGYWINPKSKAQKAENWLKYAEEQQGSWWVDWQKWLKEYSGNLLPLSQVIKKPLKKLEKAPGSYVLSKKDRKSEK